MKEKKQKLIDITTVKFLLVGVINTLVGTGTMFGLYNCLGCSYWVSSAGNYIVGSIVSYFLNKYFTFKNHQKSAKTVLKFVQTSTPSKRTENFYKFMYGLAKPVAAWIFSGFSVKTQENIAMLAGMCIFVGMNYLGQRFVVFREEKSE